MGTSSFFCYALGIATKNSKQEIIEVFYPQPTMSRDSLVIDAIYDETQAASSGNCWGELSQNALAGLKKAMQQSGLEAMAEMFRQLRESKQVIVYCILTADSPPQSVAEAYLKLHLLSHRLCKPHSLNLDGIFAVLYNIAWSSEGAIDLDDIADRQLAARLRGKTLEIKSVDKFPKMTDYVVPKGVRIAHSARVRLGAYLGPGTTVMHEGFVNFNAGTEGPAMVEGRISAGVMIGSNSDLGGGCSTMGTLSGGGSEIISVGENCLIGANGGIGFPLADNCTVEAGLYVTAGTKVNLLDADGQLVKAVKARELSKTPHLLFRRNSLSGAVECLPLKGTVSLNEELHSHN